MTGRAELAVLAAGGAVDASPWLVAVAVAFAAVAIRQTTTALRRRGESR